MLVQRGYRFRVVVVVMQCGIRREADGRPPVTDVRLIGVRF